MSVRQIKDTCTPDEIAKWKGMLDNNPQVKVKRTNDFPGLMAGYGLEIKNKGSW